VRLGDERQRADLALDPGHERCRPVRDPDFLGKRRAAVAPEPPDGPRGLTQPASFCGRGFQRLEPFGRIPEAPVESGQVFAPSRGEEEASEGGRSGLELSRNTLSDAGALHPLGKRQPEDGLLPERKQARSR